MGDSNNLDHEYRPQSGEVRGILEVISIATDCTSLQSWLEKQGQIDFPRFSQGYLIFLETGIRTFVDRCENNPVIGFESDYRSDRAIAQLPELSAVPHESEKLNFCRALEDIQKHLRSIGNASSVSDFFNDIEEVTAPFRKLRGLIQEDTAAIDTSINQAQLNNDLAILSLYTNFQQARKNRPHGYGPSNFDSWLDEGPRENAIKGYTLTLQFLWSKLLPPEMYEDAPIDELTQTDRWTPKRLSTFEEDDEGENKTSLSNFRTQIEDVAINPLEERYEDYSEIGGIYPDDLVEPVPDANIKKHILRFFSKESTKSLSELDPHDRVAYGLIWANQAEWISASVSSNHWVAETFLRGLIQTYSTFDEEIPIHITRFNHPGRDGDVVTYAVLQRVPQRSLGDPSVWLVFDRFAIETRVEGEARIRELESVIDDLSDLNPIERTEVTVGRDKFVEAISDRLTDDYLIQKQSNENLRAAIDTCRGIIPELATVYVLSHRCKEGDIIWSTKIHGEEIDVLVRTDELVRVIECKADIESTRDDSLVDQLDSKVNAVDAEDSEVRGEIWVWEQPEEEKVMALDSSDIDVFCLKETDEIIEASTEDIVDVFSLFYGEREYEGLFSPPKRFK